MQSNTDTGTP